MTSQGQRFRRRALRRGYKVDEVDSFLDRVEATLSGDPVGSAVTSQEVHDVVFRVRFGGYDEWQVDLHLDRVERQLAELEERGGYAREARPSAAERVPAERGGAPDRMGGALEKAPMAPPLRDERMPPALPPAARSAVPPRPASSAPAGPPPGYSTRYDESEVDDGYESFEPGRHGRADMTSEMRMPDRTFGGAGRADSTFGGGRAEPAAFGGGRPDTTFGGGGRAEPATYGDRSEPPAYGGGRAEPATYGGGRAEPPAYGGGRAEPPTYGDRSEPPTYGGQPPAAGGGVGFGGGSGLTSEAQRVDQLRRTFQVRRFGSGYDRAQVDRLFDGLVVAISERPGAVGDSELDPSQFSLVPGGYFEAEVDAALKEVRDLLTRRR